MATKHRIGIIGHTGRGNYGHDVDNVWLQFPNCEIVGVADADEAGRAAAVKKLKAPAAFADYRKMLDETKPAIVSVCPRWIDQHRDMVLACAQRGIHVFMEKPFCRSPAEADEIIAACEKHDVKLALSHQTRYSPKLPVVRDMILDGQIGDLKKLRGRGKEDKRGGGEDLWVLGSHIMNLIHYFGGEPQRCTATVQQDGRSITKADVVSGNEGIGPLAGDHVSATYDLDGGVTAHFDSRRNADGARFGLHIFGSKGVIEIVTGYLPAASFLADPTWLPGQPTEKKWVPISSAGLGKPEVLKDGGLLAGNMLACHDLLLAIADDRQPECSMYEGRTTIEMISAVFESQRIGGPVPMPLKNRENPLTML